MTPAWCMRNLQLLPIIGVTYVCTARERRGNVYGSEQCVWSCEGICIPDERVTWCWLACID
jgi:hypothetical protein